MRAEVCTHKPPRTKNRVTSVRTTKKCAPLPVPKADTMRQFMASAQLIANAVAGTVQVNKITSEVM